ncbi:MAG: DUF3592 domain-containing protein [Clostridia bacterium]|nr:DUF3592 domain-containing protein [Clostridia bacterium]MBQ8512647.1 DUF3592 domain-containing protein [Clostridia bacterium]
MDVLLRTRYSPETALLFCILLLPFVIWTVVKQIRFLMRARHCTELIPGEVTALFEASRGRHGSKFSPNIKYTYTGRDGMEHTEFYEAEHSYTYDEYSVGMTVHLFIDPSDGTNVYLSGEKEDAWKSMLGLTGLYLLITLAAFAGTIA